MDKFEEFQTTMAKSNELFTTFRQEMEKVFIYFSRLKYKKDLMSSLLLLG